MAQLVSELQKAGLPRQNAVAIGRILGNSLQEMRRGPETKDVTNPKMRQVDGNRRTQQFKNLDFPQGDPDYRKTRQQLSENKPRPTQASTVQSDKDPNATENSFNVSSGPFVQVEPSAEGVEIGLRIVGTNPIMTQDAESGAIVGKRIRCNAGQQTALINFNLEPRDDEYILNLSFDLDALAAALGELIANNSQNDEQATGLPGTGGNPLSNAFVDVTLGASGLCFTRANGSQRCVATTTCEDGT
jgi:hypothetical protein